MSDVKKVIDEFPFASCRYITHIVSIDKKTVKRILMEDLQMKKVLFRWIPKDLSQDLKNARVEGFKQLLSLLQSYSSAQRMKVATADES